MSAVDEGRGLALPSGPAVTDHTDDLEIGSIRAERGHPLAQSGQVGLRLDQTRPRLVHEDDRRAVRSLSRGKTSALDDRDTQDVEEIRRYHAQEHAGRPLRVCSVLEHPTVTTEIARPRQSVRQGHVGDAWDAEGLLGKSLVEVDDLRRVVALEARVEARGQQIPSVEAMICRSQIRQRLDEESGTEEEDHRERHLTDDEEPAWPAMIA